jgi:hypothetical protein
MRGAPSAYSLARHPMIDAPSQLPEELLPVDDLYLSLGAGKQIAVHRYRAKLHGCPEKPAISLDRAYSAKPLVMVEKQAMFPELAVLTFFRRKGWDGAWVDLSHRKFFDRMPNQSKGISLGAQANQAIARISQYNDNSRAGCWDLVLWADRTVAFAAVVVVPGGPDEAPVSARGPSAKETAGALGEPRMRWLAAAVKSGMAAAQFAVVEWEYRRVVARRKRA